MNASAILLAVGLVIVAIVLALEPIYSNMGGKLRR